MILLKTKKIHRVKNGKKSIFQNLVKNVEIIFFLGCFTKSLEIFEMKIFDEILKNRFFAIFDPMYFFSF